MTYETVDPDLLRYKEYQKSKGRDTAGKGSTVAELYFNPLVFEPGEQWKYGRSIDWAGLVVERVNGGMSLGAYMEEKIWKPLGMTATTFDPLSHPHVMQNLASMTVRLDDEGLVPAETTYWAGMGAPEKSPVEGGGGSLYSSTADYLKLLTAILRNDGVLLKEETMREIFEPQIDPAILQHALNVVDPAMRKVMGIPEDRAVSWALGGLVSLEDVPGGQRKGTISWAGMPSCFWWIDPQTELYGFYASQVLPTGDPPSVELNREFEKAVYQQVMA